MAVLRMSAGLIASIVFDLNIQGNCLTLGRQNIKLTRQEFAEVIEELIQKKPARGQIAKPALNRLRLLPIGEQQAMSDTQFFSVLGFDTLTSVDNSDFEGATVVHDLNQIGLISKLPHTYDFVVETGTAEHVFNTANYLENLCESVAIDGIIFQITPCNNYVDHGFYQFSPTLFYDYYRTNRFELLDIALITTGEPMWEKSTIRRYKPGELDRLSLDRFNSEFVISAVAVKKTPESSTNIVPQQRIYREAYGWGAEENVHPDNCETVPMIGKFEHVSGYCWKYLLPKTVEAGDNQEDPRRSELLLFEGDSVLGPPHQPHNHIKKIGLGAYSHWNNTLLFSTTDNTDPNDNGRRYCIGKLLVAKSDFSLV